MAIITATAVSIYAPKISLSAGSIISGNYIPIVQERIQLITNNYFNSDTISVQTTCNFNATARSITIDQTSWEEFGFKSGDDILIYRSLRNDGIVTIESISTNTAIVTSSCSVIDESYSTNSSMAIYFSLVKWPLPVIACAAKMIWYDADYRDKNAQYLKSRSLGPLSESFGSSETDDLFGYPIKIVQTLEPFKLCRLN